MAWSQGDLDVLDAAIATGALEVQYADKKVTYRTLKEMMQIRNTISAELVPVAAGVQPGRRFGAFGKGLE